MKLRIWDRLNESSEEADEIDLGNDFSVGQEHLRAQAEDWVEQRWGDNDYLSETQVQVEVVDGETVIASRSFVVHAETTVDFRGVLLTEGP